MFIQTESKAQGWRAVAVLDGTVEALLFVGRSSTQVRAGYVEAVKVALIRDSAFFNQIERDAPKLAAFNPEAMQRLVNAPWPGNVRQLRNLIESMVVLAPGTEIRASDIPADIFEGPNLVPMRMGGVGGGANREVGAQELEFILRNLVDLRLQVEELRRRLDEGPQRVQVIELSDAPLIGDVTQIAENDPLESVVYRAGMTMADVEKAVIEAALREFRGNRRRAAEEREIGERTLYRKIKAYQLE